MISAPGIQWPSELSELGPESDPALFLGGEAVVAGVTFKVVALRVMEKGRWLDFRGRAELEEQTEALEGMIESVEDLTESVCPPTVRLGDGNYLLWMVPRPAR